MRKFVLILLLTVLIGAVVFTLGGCSTPEKALKSRATDFYNFLRGERPDDSYLNYLSSVRKHEIKKKQGAEQLKLLASTISTRRSAGRQPLRSGDVQVEIQGRFGTSRVEARQDNPLAQGSTLRWVQEGGKWYLYQGSEAEVEAFGQFPRELAQARSGRGSPPKAPSQGIDKGGTTETWRPEGEPEEATGE